MTAFSEHDSDSYAEFFDSNYRLNGENICDIELTKREIGKMRKITKAAIVKRIVRAVMTVKLKGLTETAKNVNNDAFFDFEDALLNLYLSIGGVPRYFGKFVLDVAENATSLQLDDEDDATLVIAILRRINELKDVYVSVYGSSEGFWEFFSRLAEIMGRVFSDDDEERDSLFEEV